jgi:hypothetical protein
MATFDQTKQPQASGLAKVWQRTPVAVRAITQGFLVNTIGVTGFPG